MGSIVPWWFCGCSSSSASKAQLRWKPPSWNCSAVCRPPSGRLLVNGCATGNNTAKRRPAIPGLIIRLGRRCPWRLCNRAVTVSLKNSPPGWASPHPNRRIVSMFWMDPPCARPTARRCAKAFRQATTSMVRGIGHCCGYSWHTICEPVWPCDRSGERCTAPRR